MLLCHAIGTKRGDQCHFNNVNFCAHQFCHSDCFRFTFQPKKRCQVSLLPYSLAINQNLFVYESIYIWMVPLFSCEFKSGFNDVNRDLWFAVLPHFIRLAWHWSLYKIMRTLWIRKFDVVSLHALHLEGFLGKNHESRVARPIRLTF